MLRRNVRVSGPRPQLYLYRVPGPPGDHGAGGVFEKQTLRELGPQPVDAWKFFPMLTRPPCLSQSSSPSRLLSASHVPLSGSLAPLPGPLPHTCSCTHTCPPTHTPRVVVPAMKRMCLCWVWPVACIPCCSELPSPAFHERVPGLRKAAGMSPLPPSCSGLASPLQNVRK